MSANIPFTQYMLPDGRRKEVSIERPVDIAAKAADIIAEASLIELSRLLRTMWDHSTLQHLELIEAGISQSEAERIASLAAQDRAEVASMEQRAA